MPNLLTHLTIGDQKTTINSVHYIVGTGSTAGTWLGTDSSIDEYYDGLTIAYKVPVAGASTTTLNITGSAGTALGAKTVYRNASSKITTNYPAGSVVLLVYMSTGSYPGWHCVDYDTNTTYTNASLGQGYGTCTTEAATTAKAVTLSGYSLIVGGVVAVKFSYDVPANATLNINSKGAKAIRYHGSAITAGIIKANNTATFIYDGSYYHLLSIDNVVANFDMYGWTSSRALVSDSNGKVAVSAVTSTELDYLDGVTSNIQTQLNGKLTQSTADARYALKSEVGGASVQILTRAEYKALTSISGNVLYIVRG